MKKLLENVRVVLCETTHPGNIGAAARGMKTMGLEDLVLVNPRTFPSAEATARASGADDVLTRAKVVQSLDAALTDCHWVYGTSARMRSLEKRQLDARTAATEIFEKVQSESCQVAIVYGTERSGLTNEQMARCQTLLHIPTNPEYASLNLGSAVQLLAYEIRMAFIAASSEPSLPQQELPPVATREAIQGVFGHLQNVLEDVGFLQSKQQETMLLRLRSMLDRANLAEHEVHIVRGALGRVDKLVDQVADNKKPGA